MATQVLHNMGCSAGCRSPCLDSSCRPLVQDPPAITGARLWRHRERRELRPCEQGRCCTQAISADSIGASGDALVAHAVDVTRRRARYRTEYVSTLLTSCPKTHPECSVIIIVAYLALVVACITMQVPLIDNPNRAGFLALAQFPVVFLFATKNSILSLLLGPGNGYEKLNYLHRWAGRAMFLGSAVHGALWINNHVLFGLPILGQQKETSGIAAFGVLGVLVITSLRPVRRLFYQAFFVVQCVFCTF